MDAPPAQGRRARQLAVAVTMLAVGCVAAPAAVPDPAPGGTAPAAPPLDAGDVLPERAKASARGVNALGAESAFDASPPSVVANERDAGAADAFDGGAGKARAGRDECRGSVWGKDGAYDTYGVMIRFCTAERASTSRDAAADPPYERCSLFAPSPSQPPRQKRHEARLDPAATDAERTKRPSARRCCYATCSLD